MTIYAYEQQKRIERRFDPMGAVYTPGRALGFEAGMSPSGAAGWGVVTAETSLDTLREGGHLVARSDRSDPFERE